MAKPVQPARPAVIRVSPLEGRYSPLMELVRAMPAWIISAGIHGVLLVLFFLVLKPSDLNADDKKNDQQAETFNSKVEAPQKETILTNVEEGLDAEVPTNYNVERIEDVSVPGPVDPNAAVGVSGAPEGPPVTLPPPPGSGRGQGGAPVIADVAGTGVMGLEHIGGYGGMRNVPGGFAGRSGATRKQMVTEGGGSPASEAAVGKGLQWLALHQAPNGGWSLDQYHLHARESLSSTNYRVDSRATDRGMRNDTAGAAFGLLPFLAAGITHKPAVGKKAKVDNKYVKTVNRGLSYLLSKQGRDGAFPDGMYAHGLATITVCEAYGLTSDPNLKRHAQAAINYIVQAQDPDGGGWRYQPRQGGDTSVVGWQVMALKSGQMSGLNVPQRTLEKAGKWLDSCELADTSSTKPRCYYGYVGRDRSNTMTAVGVLCRMYLGTPRRNRNLRAGCEALKSEFPPSMQPNTYYEYYATQVMHHMQGDYWEFWNKGDGKTGFKGMREILIKRQDDEAKRGGNGSWSSAGDGHSAAGGRIMTTSLSLLTLEVYYRHLPLYQRANATKKN